MPSHELPLVYSGMVWDGVTEYQDITPPDTFPLGVWLVRLVGDGSRRIIGSLGVSFPMQQLRIRTAQGWTHIGVTSENPHTGGADNYHDTGRGFLNYDGTLSFDPPNQFHQLNMFREHAARFAHQLDAAMGHHTLYSAEESDRLIVLNTLADLIGNGWRKFEEWNVIDPEELIGGTGQYSGTLLWKRDRAEYEGVDAYLCGECDIATFARRFLLKANLELFRRVYRQGLIYATNRDTTPWEPRFVDVATAPHSSFYTQLRVDYHKALAHYDNVIGPAEHI